MITVALSYARCGSAPRVETSCIAARFSSSQNASTCSPRRKTVSALSAASISTGPLNDFARSSSSRTLSHTPTSSFSDALARSAT